MFIASGSLRSGRWREDVSSGGRSSWSRATTVVHNSEFHVAAVTGVVRGSLPLHAARATGIAGHGSRTNVAKPEVAPGREQRERERECVCVCVHRGLPGETQTNRKRRARGLDEGRLTEVRERRERRRGGGG